MTEKSYPMFRLNTTFLLCLFIFSSIFPLPTASRTIVDRIGRKVHLPERSPKRVIPAAPSLAETMVLIGLSHRIVAVPLFTENIPGLKDKPKIGGPLTPSYETILKLHPDLILLSKDSNPRPFAEFLDRVHIPYIVFQERSLKDIEQNLLLFQHIFPENEAISTVLNQWHSMIECFQKIKYNRNLRVFFFLALDPVIAPGRQSFVTEVFQLVGVELVTASIQKAYVTLSPEHLLRYEPEWVALPEGTSNISQEALKNHPILKYLTAVKKNRIVQVPESILRPSPGLMNTLKILQPLFHPELKNISCFTMK